MSGIPHPYFTAAIAGIGGAIKCAAEDFVVHEIPLYVPCGEGEHVYFELEKRDLSTLEAIERLRRALGVSRNEIGYAGLKDRKAVTRQVFSVRGVDEEAVRTLDVHQMRVLSVARHTNKLRVGHLRGNEFRVWVRGIAPGAAERGERILAVCRQHGIPNYFGFQRFGNRGNAQVVGRALVLGDYREAVRRILGYPSRAENNPHVVEARERFMAGDLRKSLESYPETYRDERRMLYRLLRQGDDFEGASRALTASGRKLYCSAYQSYLFNIALSDRMRRTGEPPGTVHLGDLAYLHRNGAVFLVRDLEVDDPRALAFEISPSGPLFGRKMLKPAGLQAEIEEALLEREGLPPSAYERLASVAQLEGGRRPLRVPVQDLEWRFEENDVFLRFVLPKGSYATTFLRELTKNETVPDGYYEDGELEKHELTAQEDLHGEPGI